MSQILDMKGDPIGGFLKVGNVLCSTLEGFTQLPFGFSIETGLRKSILWNSYDGILEHALLAVFCTLPSPDVMTTYVK